ncbi:MAG: DUF1294 domain-containing protein [Chloroflexi bacterium]|nr:DUF1294 domain-containing protein [Chloroflexota bacterium]
MAKYTLIPLVTAVILAIVLQQLIGLFDPLIYWLVSITLVTFLTYGYDKAIAGANRSRVPENALLLLVFVGGTVGALTGMFVFKHKTSKHSFQAKLAAVLLVQIALLVAYFYFI